MVVPTSWSSLIPVGDEVAFKAAVYNAVLTVFLILIGATLLAVYHLLTAFLQPILWAILVGTVLFPLKRRVCSGVRSWLKSLQADQIPLALGLVKIPLAAFQQTSAATWNLATNPTALVAVLGYLALQAALRLGALRRLCELAARLISFTDATVALFSSYWVLPLFCLYGLVFAVWLWFQADLEIRQGHPATPKFLARLLSVPLWAVSFCLIAGCFGPLRSAAFIGLLVATGCCLAGKFNVDHTVPVEQTDSSASPAISQVVKNRGDEFLKWLIVACVGFWVASHIWLVFLLLLPLSFAFFKSLGERYGLTKRIGEKWEKLKIQLKPTATRVYDLAVHNSIRQLVRMGYYGDQKILSGLESSMDLLASIVVMIGLLLVTILLGFFLVFQVHSETLHVVTVTSDVLTVSLSDPNSMLGRFVAQTTNFTDGNAVGDRLESLVDSAFIHGRTFLVDKVRNLADPKDPDKAELLEAQLKRAIDHLYQMWTDSRREEPIAVEESSSGLSFWGEGGMDLDLRQIGTQLWSIMQENISTIRSIGENIWAFLQSNVSLLTTLVTTILGFLLSFGFELINFFVSLIVFLTCLYYLLVTSVDNYKPLEWLGGLTPGGSGGDQKSNPLAIAAEEAISGVFVLSSKMALFYGLYVWLIHRLFDLSVVFLPSSLASLLAAVPFLAPYWVCLPGAMELWFVHNSAPSAILFVLAHLAPMTLVDAAFYQEVKGSHPYLTGLSVVGGLYWLGLEGAIFGPILLCSLLALANLYRSSLNTPAATDVADGETHKKSE